MAHRRNSPPLTANSPPTIIRKRRRSININTYLYRVTFSDRIPHNMLMACCIIVLLRTFYNKSNHQFMFLMCINYSIAYFARWYIYTIHYNTSIHYANVGAMWTSSFSHKCRVGYLPLAVGHSPVGFSLVGLSPVGYLPEPTGVSLLHAIVNFVPFIVNDFLFPYLGQSGPRQPGWYTTWFVVFHSRRQIFALSQCIWPWSSLGPFTNVPLLKNLLK